MHCNQLYKQTNKLHFLYVFILQFLYNSTCFERPFRSSSGVLVFLYSAAVYRKSRTPDDERNGPSKHVELYKNCRINTYTKCILLVCLYNKQFKGNYTLIQTYICICQKISLSLGGEPWYHSRSDQRTGV